MGAALLCGNDRQKEEDAPCHPIALHLPSPCPTARSNLDSETPGSVRESARAKISRALTHAKTGHSEAHFFNSMLHALWPQISDIVKNTIVEKIQPTLLKKLPDAVSAGLNIDTDNCHMGTEQIKFHEVKVEDTGSNIRLTTWIDWKGNPSFSMTYFRVPLGIKNVHMNGALTIELVDKLSHPPMFTGWRCYFTKSPEVTLEMQGFLTAVDLTAVSLIKHKIAHTIEEKIKDKAVLPVMLGGLIDKVHGNIFDVINPTPDGVLWVTVYCAKDLLASDTNMFSKATSDPYVIAYRGGLMYTSPVVIANCNPKFEDQRRRPWAIPFPIFHLSRESITIEIYDSDVMGTDDFLGRIHTDLSACGREGDVVTAELEDENGHTGSNGTVTVSYKYEPVVPALPASATSVGDGGTAYPMIYVGVQDAVRLPALGPKTKYWVEVHCDDAIPYGRCKGETSISEKKVEGENASDKDKKLKDAIFQKKMALLEGLQVAEHHVAELLDMDVEHLRRCKSAEGDVDHLHDVTWNHPCVFWLNNMRDANLCITVKAKDMLTAEKTIGTVSIAADELAKHQGEIRSINLPDTHVFLNVSIRLGFVNAPAAHAHESVVTSGCLNAGAQVLGEQKLRRQKTDWNGSRVLSLTQLVPCFPQGPLIASSKTYRKAGLSEVVVV